MPQTFAPSTVHLDAMLVHGRVGIRHLARGQRRRQHELAALARSRWPRRAHASSPDCCARRRGRSRARAAAEARARSLSACGSMTAFAARVAGAALLLAARLDQQDRRVELGQQLRELRLDGSERARRSARARRSTTRVPRPSRTRGTRLRIRRRRTSGARRDRTGSARDEVVARAEHGARRLDGSELDLVRGRGDGRGAEQRREPRRSFHARSRRADRSATRHASGHASGTVGATARACQS